eukprot:3932596-Rhodomonas_salina.2
MSEPLRLAPQSSVPYFRPGWDRTADTCNRKEGEEEQEKAGHSKSGWWLLPGDKAAWDERANIFIIDKTHEVCRRWVDSVSRETEGTRREIGGPGKGGAGRRREGEDSLASVLGGSAEQKKRPRNHTQRETETEARNWTTWQKERKRK